MSEGDSSNPPYDVFLSYRWVEPDRLWVRTQLIPALKRANLKTFVDFENFRPGSGVIPEMERAILESRRAICVISPEYLNGGGTAIEQQMLRILDLSGHQSKLIPLLFRQASLRPSLLSLVPVDWTGSQNDREREWARLVSLLGGTLSSPPGGSEDTVDVVNRYSLEEREILEILSGYAAAFGYNFHLAPYIPEQLLDEAIEACGIDDHAGKIVALINNGFNLPGSFARQFVAFSGNALYFSDGYLPIRRGKIAYSELPAREIKSVSGGMREFLRGIGLDKVSLGDGVVVSLRGLPANAFLKILNRICTQVALKEHSSPASALPS
jgi:hypothetical protein